MTAGDVTELIDQLRGGESRAAQGLWELYFARMVRLAHQILRHAPRRVADEEDVALSAFKSFCLGVERGRFSQLSDRNNLWPLLVAITSNKAVDLLRHQGRGKRSGPQPPANPLGLSELAARQPTPEFALQLAEEFQRRLEALEDKGLQQVALWKLEGYTTAEIADKLRCVPRTVERKLRTIRRLWGEESET